LHPSRLQNLLAGACCLNSKSQCLFPFSLSPLLPFFLSPGLPAKPLSKRIADEKKASNPNDCRAARGRHHPQSAEAPTELLCRVRRTDGFDQRRRGDTDVGLEFASHPPLDRSGADSLCRNR